MAKKSTTKKSPAKKATAKNLLTNNSLAFMERYLNNAAPTGSESSGQKIWLEYIKPYIDDHFVDNYGTAVGVFILSMPNRYLPILQEGKIESLKKDSNAP